ncbi:DUF1800 domain-containing protein [Dactylosporangium matsuzakiense]|uniref:DUF1800 domain-containing protein n=1 Tax=Dactylosporangium matsuzakiense TaxID=53360 RepID=A0A9W6KR26_9ACTN|nr:DUF1800 domain-containing protein [Dactylosporangium matsuzakiense]GLL04926.1 hypothetical protein GCM10017581_066730 [Dactylosporangium matsuzakiense]
MPKQYGVTAFTPADPVLHLLRRASFGPTVESEAELRKLGAPAWLERQLNPAAIDDAACTAALSKYTLIGKDIAGVRAMVTAGTLKSGAWDVMAQLGTAAVARAAWSRRQLFELMVDFWSNHLNVTCPSSEVWDSRAAYDALIRKHALGRFADLLKASMTAPAMLSYLDNRSSTKAKPNENYARELLELHTVGLVYSEADVKDAARLLTGLTVEHTTGLYRFDANQHATGPVTILGWRHDNATAGGGETAALAYADMLAMHPATAERLARKLCVRFVADEPPATLVAKLAKVYLDNRTAIVPVLRALFTSPEFAAAVGAKVRTPLEDVAATVRALGIGPSADLDSVRGLYYYLYDMGHAPLRWAPPNGYPDVAAAWAAPSGLLIRWNAHLNIAAGWYPKQLARPGSMLAYLVPRLPATHGAFVDAIATRLVGQPLAAQHSAALLGFLGKTATTPLKATDPAAAGRLPHLIALILDSPYFLYR